METEETEKRSGISNNFIYPVASILSIIYRSYYLPIDRTRFDVQKMAESLYHFSFVRFNWLKTEEGNDGDSSIAR